MKPFLQLVAEDLRQRIGNDFSRTIVIFPNKRACRFLNEHLLPVGGQPIWAPRYMAINEFIRSLSPLQVADLIETVCRLYHHYVRHTGLHDDLDTFYGWGERILADFDDLDKNMAPADELFHSLRDYQAIGNVGETLTDEQVEQFHRFVSGFTEQHQTVVKSRYQHLWDHLFAIYTDLRADLASESLAYEGQLYRDVAERLQRGEHLLPPTYDHVAFVGLNVVSEVERTVFEALQKLGKALFYWDYDTSYASVAPSSSAEAPNEAGVFLAQNLKRFPNALTETADERDVFNNFLAHRDERTIEYIEAPTESVQAQSVTRWLSNVSNFRPEEARETAIVLCNEALLQPVLRALPPSVTDVNITMGFPLGHTPAYALFVARGNELLERIDQRAILDALKDGTNSEKARFVAERLKAFLTMLQDDMMQEAAKQHAMVGERDKNLDILYTESYFQTYTMLGRFVNLVEKHLLLVRPFTLFKLVRQALSTLTVPFHGEPVKGLQIMGVLETRCLDFKRILMLSVGEGFLPQKATDTSFIPYLIRRHFGMTTSEHKTSVYAYYFHRLLQRAERATLEYNSSTEGVRKGEMSRFMNALLVEDASRRSPAERLGIKRYSLTSKPLPCPIDMHTAPKPADMAERVMAKVSPSKINVYMRCQLSFYYKYVLGLPETRREDAIITSQDFGTILHKAAEIFYEETPSDDAHPITPQRLQHFLKDGGTPALVSLVKRAIAAVNDEREKDPRHKEPPFEENDIATEALSSYLRQLLRFEGGGNEGQQLPAQWFVVKGREMTAHVDIPVSYGPEGSLSTIVRLEGNIDRVDHAVLSDGMRHLRIVDYKTGGQIEKVKALEDLFLSGPKHPHYALQTFLYALTMLHTAEGSHDGRELPITPALYFIKNVSGKDFTPYISVEGTPLLDFRDIAPDFEEGFKQLLAEMLDPERPFTATPVTEHCENCAFTSLCGKFPKK